MKKYLSLFLILLITAALGVSALADTNTAKGRESASKIIKLAEKKIEFATVRVNNDANATTKAEARIHLDNATSLLAQANSSYNQQNYSESRHFAIASMHEAHRAVKISMGWMKQKLIVHKEWKNAMKGKDL